MYESEFNCTIEDDNERQIDLVLDEDALILRAKHGEVVVGEMQFQTIEFDGDDLLKLSWMYLDIAGPGYTGSGIGRHMLKLMNDFNGGPVVAESVGGLKQDDGSHLTGGADGFVTKMRAEGLIA